MSFAATQMNLEIIILSEVSQTEKDKSHMTLFICRYRKNLKKNTSELINETEIDSQTRKQTYG